MKTQVRRMAGNDPKRTFIIIGAKLNFLGKGKSGENEPENTLTGWHKYYTVLNR